MAYPYLAFCPYLPVGTVIDFADWQLGPLRAFEGQWTNPKRKEQSETILGKFVDGAGLRIENPSLLCRRHVRIDGQLPTQEECRGPRSRDRVRVSRLEPETHSCKSTPRVGGAYSRQYRSLLLAC